MQGDPTEGALIVAARKAGLEDEALDARFERVAEVPFSSERKLMSTVHTDAERQERLLVFTKGAPDVLLARCTRGAGRRRRRAADRRSGARRSRRRTTRWPARRCARSASPSARCRRARSADDELDERSSTTSSSLGLIGMIDPPREEAKEAVARAKGAGIRPIMITGDHPRTAAVIADELGIAERRTRAVTGRRAADRCRTRRSTGRVREVSVYARVNPEHKLRIVKALQRQGAIVAMTGDGVNDAPALKTADIGVAMGITGTDVSKEAADMVLADDNFASIVAAVEEGRAIFANIRKFLRYLLSSNIGEVMTMFFGVLLADVIGLQRGGRRRRAAAARDADPLDQPRDRRRARARARRRSGRTRGSMNKPPRPRGEGVITRRMWAGHLPRRRDHGGGDAVRARRALPGGLIEGSGNMRYAQTMAFTTLMFFQLFNVFNARSDEQSAFDGLFSNRWLWAAVGLSLVLQAAVIYVPFLQQAFSTVSLSAGDWLRCVAVASSVLWLRELSKLVTRGLAAPRLIP